MMRRYGYVDRADAAEALVAALQDEVGPDDLLVLGLPRGGVPVAYAVARALRAPLDVIVVRKLGVPGQPELAMGAVASGGVRVMNPRLERVIPARVVDAVTERVRRELAARELELRGERPPPAIAGKRVILVDDGIATGSTMRAAVHAVRSLGAARVVVAVPVAPSESVAELEPEADAVICPLTPRAFWAIGQFYDDFAQVSTAEARELLERARREYGEQP